MTTGTSTDYGSTFQFASGTVYPALVVEFPSLDMKEIDITNHGGGGSDEAVPSGLTVAGPFTLEILGQHGTFSTLKALQVAKTVGSCLLTNPITTYTFSGMITGLKEGKADAQKPDAVKLTVTVKSTGLITVS